MGQAMSLNLFASIATVNRPFDPISSTIDELRLYTWNELDLTQRRKDCLVTIQDGLPA